MLQKVLRPHFWRYLLQFSPWLVVAVLALILSFGSAVNAYRAWGYQPFVVLERSEGGVLAGAGDSPAPQLTVEISGAVQLPGVYQVAPEARWQEVLLMANGFDNGVDRQFVHQELNLAVRVKDQEKLYIPFASESASIRQRVPQETPSNQEPGARFIVNEASSALWDEIPGIGPARIQKIEEGLPYSSKDDFLARSGISESVYKNIEEIYTEIIY